MSMCQKKTTCNRKSSNEYEKNNSGKHGNDRKHSLPLKLIYTPDGYSDQCVWEAMLPCLSVGAPQPRPLRNQLRLMFIFLC